MEAKRFEVLRWNDPRLTQYPASVAATGETTFELLQEPERLLLEVLSWLASEPVPLCLLDAEPLVQAVPDPIAASRRGWRGSTRTTSAGLIASRR
jgi:hypothetical protein